LKITTLVPAFKVQFFLQLLVSLRCQAVKPHRVIISDDTENNDFIEAMKEGRYAEAAGELDIELVEGPKLGHYANFRSLVDRLPGDSTHFHVLCDDDIIYPDFYRQHLRAHESAATPCSFSKRWIALANGQPAMGDRYPVPLDAPQSMVQRVEADYLFHSTLPFCHNWLGEFSNAVFSREAAPLFLEPKLAGILHYGLYDLGTFLKSARDHGALVINEHLGAFRRSRFQHSAQPESPTVRLSYAAWIALSIAAFRIGKLSQAQLFGCAERTLAVLRKLYAADTRAKEVIALEPVVAGGDVESFIGGFLAAWPSFYRHLDPSLF